MESTVTDPSQWIVVCDVSLPSELSASDPVEVIITELLKGFYSLVRNTYVANNIGTKVNKTTSCYLHILNNPPILQSLHCLGFECRTENHSYLPVLTHYLAKQSVDQLLTQQYLIISLIPV